MTQCLRAPRSTKTEDTAVNMVDNPTDDADPRRQVSEEQDRARALAAVMRDQSERADTALEGELRRQRRARTRRSALIVVWVGVAYVWFGTPPWLTVNPPPAQTIGEEAQALRLNVFLQSQQIEAYRVTRGRLPYVLEEAGPPFQGMEYRRRDSRSYDLNGASNRVHLRYGSETPALDFVGESVDLLEPVPVGGGDD
jgi:hypothetical protein